MRPAYSTPPGLDDIEAMARWALTSVPETFRQYAANLVIRVEDFVDEETEEELDLDSPFDLLGLYRGVSLNNKSVTVSSQDVDMVFLYRRPILDYWCETGEDLAHLVRHVLIHEIGHHFGFSDDDMDAIEDEA
ncbi:MAG: metallopeptidase family protein [Rhodospirillales bacterium]